MPGLRILFVMLFPESLCRNLLNYYGKELGMDSERVPRNMAVSRFAEALAKAWNEYNNIRLDSRDVLVLTYNHG